MNQLSRDGREGLVKQAQDRSGQQTDERPNHAPDDSLHNVNTSRLGVNTSRLGVNASGLGVNASGLGVNASVDLGKPRLHLGPDLGDLRLHLSPEIGHLGLQLGDLRSNDSDDVLPAQLPDFLNGGVSQVGVRSGSGVRRAR